jgi:uncharacterized membrane protein
MRKPQHPSILKRNIRAVAEIEEQALLKRSVGERLGDRIASVAGSMPFAVIHVLWFGGWIAINTDFIPGVQSFDPYPFGLLTLVVSLEAIFLSIFVLLSQNRLTREADKRAHLDLQVNLLAEQESTIALRLLQRICDRLGITTEADDEGGDLVAKTDVATVVSELETKPPTAEAEDPERR